jgi:hypothetical protein
MEGMRLVVSSLGSHLGKHFAPLMAFNLSKGQECFSFFVVLGFELRAYTLSHSTSPFL